MVRPVIQVDPRSLANVRQMLTGIKNGMPKATAGAINDLMRGARTAITRGVAKKIKIKQKDVRKFIKIDRASAKNLNSKLSLDATRRPSLIDFSARQTRKGVSYKIAKQGSRQTIPGAFIATGKGGNRRVFRRAGKSRLPLLDLKGPSPNLVVIENAIDRKATKELADKLPERIEARAKVLIERSKR